MVRTCTEGELFKAQVLATRAASTGRVEQRRGRISSYDSMDGTHASAVFGRQLSPYRSSGAADYPSDQCSIPPFGNPQLTVAACINQYSRKFGYALTKWVILNATPPQVPAEIVTVVSAVVALQQLDLCNSVAVGCLAARCCVSQSIHSYKFATQLHPQEKVD